MGNLRVVRLRDDAVVPTRAHPGDAGLDLVAVSRLELAPGERGIVDTGVAVAVPDGHAGFLLRRSGLAANHGVTVLNAPGLIDSGYRGELKVILLNTDREATFVVEPGERVAQLVVLPIGLFEPLEVEQLDSTERGHGGHGSTGR
jgi:dUTP pyrophosphatase